MKRTRTLGAIIDGNKIKLVMEVLKDNYNERVFICENCESELKVHRDDLIRHDNGETYFTCPLCGERTYVCFPL